MHCRPLVLPRRAVSLLARASFIATLLAFSGCADDMSQTSAAVARGRLSYQAASLSCQNDSCTLTLTARLSASESAQLSDDNSLRRKCEAVFADYKSQQDQTSCSSPARSGQSLGGLNASRPPISEVKCSFPVQGASAGSEATVRTATYQPGAQDSQTNYASHALCTQPGVQCTLKSDACTSEDWHVQIFDPQGLINDHLKIAQFCSQVIRPSRSPWNFKVTYSRTENQEGLTVCEGFFGINPFEGPKP